jgi:hypothetical protein
MLEQRRIFLTAYIVPKLTKILRLVVLQDKPIDEREQILV